MPNIIPYERNTKIISTHSNVYRGELPPHFTDEELERIKRWFVDRIMESKGKAKEKYERYYLLTLFLMYTGARIEEIIGGIKHTKDKKSGKVQAIEFRGLAPSDIFLFADRTKDYMKVITLKHKTVDYRVLAVHDQLRMAIDEYYRHYQIDEKSTDQLFKIKRQSYHKLLKKMEAELGFHINAHKFRHTVAVKLLQNGVPLNRISRVLGHSNVVITGIYLTTTEYKDSVRLL